MGVQGLWTLLAPVGRRVSIETLAGKTLAIDMSIWLTQFIKAMRGEDGTMMKNAHLIGTIRRILKLLFQKIRPVFVFDGGVPIYKLKTIDKRRRLRSQHEDNVTTAARRILLAQLKQAKIKAAATTDDQSPNFASTFNRPDEGASSPSSSAAKNSPSAAAAATRSTALDDLEWLNEYDATHTKDIDADSSDEVPDYELLDGENFDIEAVAALPTYMRKGLVESARRAERVRSRANFLPVAGNPELYSQTQLSNFLKQSSLNRRVAEVQSFISGRGEGRAIMAEAGRKYVLLGPEEVQGRGAQSSSSSSNVTQQERHSSHNFSTTNFQSASSADLFGGGGFLPEDPWGDRSPSPAPVAAVTSAPTPALAAAPEVYDDVDWSDDEEVVVMEKKEATGSATMTVTGATAPLSKDVVDSAISTASHMTDWAGRAVQRAFRLHLQQSDPAPRGASSEGRGHSSEGEGALSEGRGASSKSGGALSESGGALSEGGGASSEGKSSSSSATWTCSACTFVNASPSDFCELCHTDRDEPAAAHQLHDGRLLSTEHQASSSIAPSSRSRRGRRPAADEEEEEEEQGFISGALAPFEDEGPPPLSLPSFGLDDSEEEEEARGARRTAMRDADKLTETMKEEVLELLRAFGLPYLIAPFEAEAQCAVLQELGLVDGVVTEDSDAFLFGADTVYKNIFNDRKFVEVYHMSDVQRELGLSREELIALSFFLGSDYCEGVSGVGIVNAAEIVHAFPMHTSAGGALAGMRGFKGWLEGYSFEDTLRDKRLSSKKKVGRLKKRVRARDGDGDGGDSDGDDGLFGETDGDGDGEAGREDAEGAALEAFDAKHRTGRAKWKVPGSFPDEKVYTAYKHPAANRATEAFDFPVPKIHRVRAYCRDHLGWTDGEMDTSVDPVIARFAERTVQTRIDGHFMVQYDDDRKVAQIQSQRLRAAVQGKVAVQGLKAAGRGAGKARKKVRRALEEEEG